MEFLYFFPGRESVKAHEMTALGLGHVWGKPTDPIAFRGCSEGPGGGRGCVVARCSERIGHYPDLQVWRKIPGSDIHVGYFIDDRPQAYQLARSLSLEGHLVSDCFGDSWMIPAARRWVEQDGQMAPACGLPFRFALDDSGRWIANDVHRNHKRLWELAIGCETARNNAFFEAADKLEDGSDVVEFTFEFTDMDALCIEALSTNYRIAAAELDLLEIYDAEFRTAVIDAVLDLPTWKEWLKKKDQPPAGSSS